MPSRPWRGRLPLVRLAVVLILTLSGTHAPGARAVVPLGGVAIVITTEGDTLALREGPGFEFERLTSFAEGTILAVLDGPATSADGTVWYRVSDGWLTGWSAAEFLAPLGDGSEEGAPLLPADGLRVGGTGGEGLRLRDAPGLEAEILLVIPEGAAVTVIGAARRADGYDWAPVEYDGIDGWIAAAFLGAGGGGPAGIGGEPWDEGAWGDAPDAPVAVPVMAGLAIGDRAAVVETGGLDLRIRAGIGLDAPIYAYVPAEAVVLIVNGPRLDAAGDEWYGVDYDGVQGWVLAEHLARTDAAPSERSAVPGVPPPPPPPPGGRMRASAGAPLPPPLPLLPPSADRGRAIVEEALRHLDTPYVWGGDGPAGWDCSGMIQWVYARVTGVTLPRVSQQQFLIGTPIPANELQSGDLVFFADTAGPGITHNGIALGDGRFIHARSEQFGTTITRLDDPYWAAHYAGARRP